MVDSGEGKTPAFLSQLLQLSRSLLFPPITNTGKEEGRKEIEKREASAGLFREMKGIAID